MKTITITVELPENHAWALAQLCKRITYFQCERLSDPANKEEPYQMIAATNAVARALAEKGYAPR